MFRLPAFLSAVAVCLCFTQNFITADEEEHIRKMGGPNQPTALELKMLPSACIAKQTEDPEEVRKWKTVLGEAFVHLHHYCHGLNALNRINRGLGDRDYLLDAALSDFRYMEHQVAEKNVLIPEVEFNIGYVLYQLNRIKEAITPIQKAIRLKPDYVQAYLLLSYCYDRVGDTAGAAGILRSGLAKAPNSQALQSALARINSAKPESKENSH